MVAQAERNTRARRGRPLRLDGAYLRGIAKLEALPENQSGADKAWVERAVRSWRQVCRRAVRVR